LETFHSFSHYFFLKYLNKAVFSEYKLKADAPQSQYKKIICVFLMVIKKIYKILVFRLISQD